MYRELLFYTFAFSAFIPIYQAYKRPRKLYELPFLYGVACFVFIIPTLFFVKEDNYLLTDSQYNRYVLNAIICFWAAIWGYHSINNAQRIEKNRKELVYSDNKIFIAILPLILIGGYASSLIDPSEFGSEQGGIFAIILFFSRLLRPAIVILFTTYLMKSNQKKLILLLFYLALSLQFIIISGRRSEVFNLVITIIFPLFFIKKAYIPKQFIIPAIILVITVIAVLPVTREFTKRGEFNQLLNLSLTEISSAYLSGERTNEVIEAAINMEVVDREGIYNYGVSMYNYLVHQYASSTIFGSDVKKSLFIEKVNMDRLREKYFWMGDAVGYKGYLSYTGFAATFYEFGYFGCILFFLFGRLTKSFWVRTQDGNIFWVLFYCCFATFILFSVYHSIMAIPTIFLPILIILIGVMNYAKIKSYTINNKSYA
ncbi:hypothetical protein WJR50_29100 [Catalinimonas sp. 4WD22]|uniref:hypothetical protein n=1 Tax=Catalinimonas locisalis TaxID=3133978 RepID=UPI003100D565